MGCHVKFFLNRCIWHVCLNMWSFCSLSFIRLFGSKRVNASMMCDKTHLLTWFRRVVNGWYVYKWTRLSLITFWPISWTGWPDTIGLSEFFFLIRQESDPTWPIVTSTYNMLIWNNLVSITKYVPFIFEVDDGEPISSAWFKRCQSQ